ncbi:acyl-CoA dehydrogenase family protein, partial [Mycobacterium sp. NAZ190054]|uniref:acyl-CoA dehydrogenase family protein n=1 Tax=Mycobacterium sp. NAZ190054 TaxID=1747766 RepID=UPI000A5BA9D9
MQFTFSDDEEAYRRELNRFARKVLAPHYQADDKTAKLRPELVADMAGMGLTGLRIPERFGGQEASAVIAGLAAEEVAYGDFNATYLIIVTALISDILTRNATEAQQAEWLPAIASGEVVPAFCITEPQHGTDAAALEMRAEPTADGWLLTGE